MNYELKRLWKYIYILVIWNLSNFHQKLGISFGKNISGELITKLQSIASKN